MPLASASAKSSLQPGSMLSAFAFGCMITVEPGMEIHLLVLAGIASCEPVHAAAVNPSIKSDIDLDRYRERKEGAHFAAWYLYRNRPMRVTH